MKTTSPPHHPAGKSGALIMLRILVAAFIANSAVADIPVVIRYGTFETNLLNETEYADPYRDVTLNVVFTNPAGEEIRYWGFHDGGNVWKIRFRPGFPGMWAWTASFSDGSVSMKGEFRCLWRYAEHDPISVNPVNPVWFARGVAPFQVRALHIGDRFFAENWPDTERQDFIKWAAWQGYNTLSIGSHLLNRDSEGRGAGWDTPDLWPLNAAEFRKMESILDDLEQLGFAVFPFAGFFGRDSNFPRDWDDQQHFLRYAMARIGHYGNLFYNVAGPEPDLKGKPYLTMEEINRIGRFIRDHDIYDHPLTVHCPTGPDLYRESDWSTFGTVQGPKTLDRNKLNRGLLESLHPGKPLFAQETLWSGNIYHQKNAGREYTDDDIRKNAYTICMSGAGFCFADNNGNSSSGFSGSLDLRDRVQNRHDIVKQVWDFMDTVPYFEMRPRQDLVSAGYCLAQPGEHYLVYMEHPASVDVSVETGLYGVEWIDARNPHKRYLSGTTRDGSNLSPPGHLSCEAPGEEDDWILHLRKRGFGAPDQVHLSWAGDPRSTMAITWHTAFGNNPAVVEFRLFGSNNTTTISGNSFPSTGKGWLHRAELAGLVPGTRYEYRVSSDPGINPPYSDWRPFKTMPDGDAPIRIGFVADIGLGGRLDGNANGTLRIMNEMLALSPDLILGCGDYAYANRDARYKTNPEKVDEWFNQYEPLISQVPFMAQYGNHETRLDEKYEDWAPRFAHPEGDASGRNYSFDVGKLHITAFFCVGDIPSDSELAWLENALKSARDAGQEWLIVFQHEPIYAHGRSHPSKLEIAERIIPVLEKHKVDLHLSSHDQNYERTYPLKGHPSKPSVMSSHDDSYKNGDGVLYCKVSPSGKKSETGNRFSEFTVPQQEFVAFRNTGNHHYAIIELSSSQLRVDVYSMGEDGIPSTVIDSFCISK